MMTTYPLLALQLASLFDSLSEAKSTAPLEEQWYWRDIQHLIRLAEGHLDTSIWVEELLKRLP